MEITVKIEWDKPDDKNWLNQFNIETALSAYCKNTKFKVTEIKKLRVKNEGADAKESAFYYLLELEKSEQSHEVDIDTFFETYFGGNQNVSTLTPFALKEFAQAYANNSTEESEQSHKADKEIADIINRNPSSFEWLLIKGMEITNSEGKYASFEKLLNTIKSK